MASRDKKDLRPELVQAYEKAVDEYKRLYPNDPQPFITCTFRSNEEQNILFNKRPKVTNAKAGQSPHNYNPSFAFDIGFITVDNKMSWNSKYFKMFADCNIHRCFIKCSSSSFRELPYHLVLFMIVVLQ